MRFLVLTQYFPPEMGAAQLRLAAMIRELRAAGHDVEVVTGMPNHPTGRIFEEYRGRFYRQDSLDGVRVHRLWLYASLGAGWRRMANYLSFVFTSIVGLFRARRPDFIFVESPPLFLSLPAVLAARMRGARVIYNVADMWLDAAVELGILRDGPLLRFARAFERWTLREVDYVTTVTEGLRDRLLARGVSPDRMLFLPNGVDTTLFAPRPPDEALARSLDLVGRHVVLYAGTHGYSHGLDVALSAAKLLDRDNVTIVLVGDGSEKDALVARARREEIRNVLFLDSSAPEYIARLYSISRAGLSTLRYSPLFEATRPVKIFSIMAAGKPVVYSGSGEGAKLVADANAGVVVPPDDATALADSIRRLIATPTLAQQLGANGRAFVEEHYSWGTLVRSWLAGITASARSTALSVPQ
jgi:glycosyltransferase involved in cell wall biosynthesis